MSTTVTGYDPELKFYATRYKQGGRVVFSLDLSLAQIASLLPAPDPMVAQPDNREINLPHAASFGRYIREQRDWVSPVIALRGPNIFEFETMETISGAEFGIISFPKLAMTDLRILDGQHRVLGIHLAIRGIADDLDKLRSSLASARKNEEMDSVINSLRERIAEIVEQRERMEVERVSVQIFVEEDAESSMQMFADIADNARGIKRSTSIRLDGRKIVNRVFKTVMLHPLLVDRIDTERDVLGRNNHNFLSARHVAEIARIIAVGMGGKVTRRLEDELSEDEMVKATNEFFDLLMTAYPQLTRVANGSLDPAELRQSSMLGSPVTIRVLAGVFHELKSRGMDDETIVRFFHRLNHHMSVPASSSWVDHVGGGLFFEGGLAPMSRRQDLKEFKDVLVGWARGSIPRMAS